MKPLRTLLVDDEPLARERLGGFLARESDLEIVGEFSDGQSALDFLQAQPVDVIFSDIEMPGLNGVQLAASLPSPGSAALVFVTAHPQFALEAFGLRAVDYLLKPFDRERLQATLARVREHHRLRSQADLNQRLSTLLEEKTSPTQVPSARLSVKTDGRIVFIRPEDLEWAESADNYVILHTKEGRLMVRETLSKLEEKLDPAKFARVNRSAIVQLDQIRELQPAFHGDYVVILRNGARLPLSRSLRGQLERFLR